MNYESNEARKLEDEAQVIFPLEWYAAAVRAVSEIAENNAHLERLQAERLARMHPGFTLPR